MAKIQSPDLGQAEAVNFTQQGVSKDYIAKGLEVMGATALEAYKGKRLAQGDADARSVRDRFVGKQLEELDDQLLGKTEDLQSESLLPLGIDGDPTETPVRDLKAIESLRDDISFLEGRRQAVMQDLKTNDEFRREAESKFYQSLSRAPGLKSELIEIYQSYLGISPQGQSAALQYEHNNSLAKAQADAQDASVKKMDSYLITNQLKIEGMDVAENYFLVQPAQQKLLEAQRQVAYVENLQKLGKLKTEQEQRLYADKTISSLWESSALSLKGISMHPETGENLTAMSASSILNMNDEQRVAWGNNLENSKQALLTKIAMQRDSFNLVPEAVSQFDRMVERIEARYELLTKHLNSKNLEELTQTKKNVFDFENQIIIATATNGMLQEPQVAMLAALSQNFPAESNLFLKSVGSLAQNKIIQNLLEGTAVQTSDEPSKIEATRSTMDNWGSFLNNAASKYGTGKIQVGGDSTKGLKNMLISAANSDDSVIPESFTKGAISLLTNDKFLTDLRRDFPQDYAKIQKKYKPILGDYLAEYSQQLTHKINAHSPDGGKLFMRNYWLEDNNGQYIVTPTQELIESRRGLYAVSQVPQQINEDNFSDIKAAIDVAEKLYGWPRAEAARQVARSLGMSTRDLTITPQNQTAPTPAPKEEIKEEPKTPIEPEAVKPPETNEYEDQIKFLGDLKGLPDMPDSIVTVLNKMQEEITNARSA